MRMANPALSVFEKPQTWADLDARERKLNVMTMSGTVQASFMLLGVCIAAAYATWAFMPPAYQLIASLGAGILFLVLAFVLAFKPKLAPVLGIPGAALMGVFVGAISMFYASLVAGMQSEAQSTSILASAGAGLVMQAVLLTFGVFAGMLFLYTTRTIRATPTLIKGIMAATFGFGFMCVGYLLLGLFTNVPSMLEMGWIGVGISGVIVVIAAFNLIIDFHVIEEGVKQEAPKYMEWYAAWGLIVTLVWLYVSILRLLALLALNRE